MVNAVMDTECPDARVVRLPDVVEGQSIDNRGSIQITSAFGEHEMGELHRPGMTDELFRGGVGVEGPLTPAKGMSSFPSLECGMASGRDSVFGYDGVKLMSECC
ncbi:hypothetical protein TNCV_178521 [Trichonephila clavipes]|nr:hypothetical protein TNCV_178521 [Trichonephila clavipes]